jgi:hypothetical protein
VTGQSSAKNAVAYTTIVSDADAELAAARERAARQRIEDDVAAIFARMDDAASEAEAAWIALDDSEDDEGWHTLAVAMRLAHLRGRWAEAQADWRAAAYRGEVTGAEPRRPEVFSYVDEVEAQSRLRLSAIFT